VEHYEMASYGTARTWAEQLGLEEEAALLKETFEEEKETDAKLSEIAEAMVNADAEAPETEAEGAERNGRSNGSKRSKGAKAGRKAGAKR